MVADIIQPSQFGRNSNAPQLVAPEAAPEPQPQAFEDLDLTEPRYGEELLGTLTDEEAQIFVDYFNANAEVMALDREANGAALVMMGNDYRSGAIQESMNRERGYDLAKSLDPELMRDFARAANLVALLKSKLFWGLSERFGCHDWLLGVRTKRRVYKVKRKW